MPKTIDYVMATIGGAIGATILPGMEGLALGAGTGYIISKFGRECVTENVSKRQRRDINNAMHLATSAGWAVNPVYGQFDLEERHNAASHIYRNVVYDVADEVSPFHVPLLLHCHNVFESRIAPFKSMTIVKKLYGEKRQKSYKDELAHVVDIIFDIYGLHNDPASMHDWFMTWCRHVGLDKNGNEIWANRFGAPLNIEDYSPELLFEEAMKIEATRKRAA